MLKQTGSLFVDNDAATHFHNTMHTPGTILYNIYFTKHLHIHIILLVRTILICSIMQTCIGSIYHITKTSAGVLKLEQKQADQFEQ